MPSGDIGSIIEQRAYYNYNMYPPTRVPGTNIFLVPATDSSSAKAAVRSYSCDAAGNISDATLSSLVFTTTGAYSGPTSQIFHISGYIYGMVFNYYNTAYGTRVGTFSVNPTTGALAQIASTIIHAGDINQLSGQAFQNCLHIYGNVWAVFGSQTHSGQWYAIKTFSVTPDGLTIAYIATWESAAAGGEPIGTAAVELAANKFAVLWRGYGAAGGIKLKTFTISDAGAISTIATSDLDTDSSSVQSSVGMIQIYGTTYLCAYYCAGGCRVRTVTLNSDGSIGATLDTDDSIMVYQGVFELSYVVSQFVLLGAGYNGSRLVTFGISADGTIGSIIDSMNGIGTYLKGAVWYGSGNIYTGIYQTGATNYGFSIDIVIPPAVIETLEASDVKHDRATLWGNITEIGAAYYYGFDWSLGDGSFENELLGTDPIIAGIFNLELTGLSYNTAYKVRAKISVDGVTWTYGITVYFTTTFPVPQVETDPASAADDHWIDAVGMLVNDGGVDPVDEYGFAYGLTTREDMLGLFDNDLDKQDDPNDCTGPNDYDACEKVVGTLVAPLLSVNAASGQADVTVVSVVGLTAGLTMKLVDDDNEEVLTIDHIVGLVVTMTTNLVHTYYTSKAARLCQQVTIRLRNLEYAKRYFFRFWAHNKYGWGWGGEMCALTSDTVNIMIPTATASKGIRFCIPGKINFPPTGMYYDTRHHLLVKSPDSYYISPAEGGGGFGFVAGKYVCERQYWSEATNIDLYTMSNAVRRTGVPIKVKYKARIGNNSYGLGNYHKRVINNGASSLTSGYMSAGAGYLAWYCEIFTLNPWTSAAWTVAETDDLLYGISIRSGTGWEQPLLDCIEGRICWADAAVTTKPAKLGSDLSHVKFHGLVTEDEAEDCVVYFEYGPTAAYGSATADQAAVKGQHFYADQSYTPPPPGTYYHYRAVIETACGETFYGSDMLYPNGLILELAFEQSILTVAPTWTDVTSEYMQLRIKRGRDHQLDNCAAGTATFIMRNASGNWWRKNTAGAYFGSAGGVKPLTLIRLRRSYNGVYNVFYGTLEGIVPAWLHEHGGYSPVAQLSCVDAFKSFNKYRIIDADYALTEDEPAASSHVVLSSVRGYVEGQTVKLYDSENSENLIIQQVVPAINTIIFTTTTTYAYTVGNGAKLKKWPVVLSGVRVHDICLECLWPLALTSIDAGQVEVSELKPETAGTNALSELQATKKAEDGNLFMAGNGWLVYQDQAARSNPVSTDLYTDVSALTASQGTFKDDGTMRLFISPEISDDDEFIYNECDIVGDDCGDQLMLDAAYQLEQGPRAVPDQSGSIIHNASDAIAQAFMKVERYKDGQQRVKALAVDADADEEDLTPRVCGYELGTRIILAINSTRNPAMLNQAYHIEGVQHDHTVGKHWITKWQLWDPSKYRVYNALHTGWLGGLDDTTNYMACHDAAAAYPSLVLNDEPWPGGVRVGQWDTYAGAIWLSSLIYRGYLEFDTSNLTGAPYPPTKAFLLIFLQSVSLPRAWSTRLVPCSPLNNPLVDTNYHDLLNHTDDYGSIAMPSAGGVWLVIELTASGVASINYAGETRFGMRSDRDCDVDDPGTNQQEWALFDVSNDWGKKPKLIVQLG